MKQTAVEWLVEELSDVLGPMDTNSIRDLLLMDAINRAKEMEKEMIIETSKNSYIAGYLDNQAKVDDSSNFPEDYYNETFKQQEQ
jgi:hypothetical protein